MSTTHLKKSVIAGGNINTIKALKKYWNSPVSDIDDRSSEAKYTILQMALLLNKRKIVEYMIPQKDLDLTTRATDGTTALMIAIDKDLPLDWIRAMLERGAAENIDIEDYQGRTALDRCTKGSPMYELLIKYGATPRPPTPPPEPAPSEEDKNKPAISLDNTSPQSGATDSIQAESLDAALNRPPGLEEHPGFWASMCGCAGRQGKHTIETIESPPKRPPYMGRSGTPHPAAKKATALSSKTHGVTKTPFPKAKASPKLASLPKPKTAVKAPATAQPQAAAA